MSKPKLANNEFLSGGGEMGMLIRNYKWEDNYLGAPEGWPQTLKIAVRLILSSGHPMFIWWGPELIQFYNDAYRHYIGPERHPSALGAKGKECWEEIWPVIGPQISQVMEGKGSVWHENALVPITRNGRREDVYWTYSYDPLIDFSRVDHVSGVLVICTDTTEQVIAEKIKHAREARWRELFNQAAGFMCILSGPNHVYEFVNKEYLKIINRDYPVGKTVVDVLPEIKTNGIINLLDQVYLTGVPYIGKEVRLNLLDVTTKQEREIYVDFVYQPIRDSAGKITGIFVDGHDVTAQVIATQKLKSEDKKKDEFLAMLAHELRNPLAPIRNSSEILIQMAERFPEAGALGTLISRQTTHMTHLVDDLLDISRITHGKIDLHLTSINLDAIIKMVIDCQRPLIEEKLIALSYKGPEFIFIQGDATRIQQCLTNILVNAVKYTDKRGEIQILLTEENGMAIIDIIDNGIGISASTLPDIFDLFVQANRNLDRSQGGLGIGLAVVRRLLQMQNGSVSAHSEGLGRGAKFTIRLPVINPPIASKPNVNLNIKYEPKHIVIVDDNVDAADSLAQLLSLQGHKTQVIYSGMEAINSIEIAQTDVVLLDIGLPDIDGYEVARQLKTQHATCILIALTGYGQEKDIHQAFSVGFNEHITKPVTLKKLEEIIYKYADRFKKKSQTNCTA